MIQNVNIILSIIHKFYYQETSVAHNFAHAPREGGDTGAPVLNLDS